MFIYHLVNALMMSWWNYERSHETDKYNVLETIFFIVLNIFRHRRLTAAAYGNNLFQPVFRVSTATRRFYAEVRLYVDKSFTWGSRGASVFHKALWLIDNSWANSRMQMTGSVGMP